MSSQESEGSEFHDIEKLNQSESDGESPPASDSDEPQPTPGSKKDRKSAPSAAEVRAAREANETFRSNVFKLQLDELLKEISLDVKYSSQARKLLFALREKIAQTVPVSPVSFDAAQKFLTTKIPYPTDASEHASQNGPFQYKLGYEPPSEDSINVIGSWSLHTTIRRPTGPIAIDLLVLMPDELFETKDYLDYRYHRKRAFYLAALASQLAEAGLPLEPRFEKFNGHSLKPVLKLVPIGKCAKLGKKVVIYVHACPKLPSQFPISKLNRDRNAVRSTSGPTPVYNWSILSDVSALPLLRFLHSTAATTPAFCDAARLGSLWLQQRRWSSDVSHGGFGAFEFTVLLAVLLNGGSTSGKNRLLPGFSSYQLFKGTLMYIAESEYISLAGPMSTDKLGSWKPADAQGLFFTDYNLDVLTNMALWAPKLLRHDAQLSVDMLNDPTRDRFGSLFLHDVGAFHLCFDTHFEVVINETDADSGNGSKVLEKLHNLLHRAWGPRYKAMKIVPMESANSDFLQSSWPLSSDVPKRYLKRVQIGAVLHPLHSEKRVTLLGPEFGDDPDAFKSFWGPKASLRRFQNGQIKDAVIWSHGLRPIAQEAAVYALSRHLDVEVSLPQLLERKLPIGPDPTAKAGTGFLTLKASFDKLGQTLLDLRGALPLRVIALYGTSAALRASSIIEPQSFDPSFVAEGMMEMETSSKWPSDIEAIEKVKSAFFVKLAETFRQLHPQYYVVIGLEPSAEDSQVESPFVIIQTPEGFYFKLKMFARTHRARDGKLANLADHTRLISTMINRYPNVLSTAIRLVKLWLQKQLLMSYISEPAAELLVLHVFANSSPWAPPVCATSAFWRVLELLARWDWRETNLVIDVDRHLESSSHHVDKNQQVTGCDTEVALFQSISAAFAKQRKQDPALTQAPWAVSTKLDHEGICWTSWEPRSRAACVIAGRVTALARNAKPGMRLFDTPTTDFDVAWRVTRPSTFSTRNKNVVVSDPHKAIINSHDVAIDLASALKTLYRDSLILFYSGEVSSKSSEGDILCGIWNRNALAPVPRLKATLSYPLKPVKTGYELDKNAVIAEIERLGSGILTRSL